MSAHRIEGSERAMVSDKVFSFLTKPVAPLQLLDEVAAAFRKGDHQ
jgi:hypothetical protein